MLFVLWDFLFCFVCLFVKQKRYSLWEYLFTGGKPICSLCCGKPCLPGGCSFVVRNLLTGSILVRCGETIRSRKRVYQRYAHLLFGTCWPEGYTFVVEKSFALGNVFTGSILIYWWEPVDWKCTLRRGKPVHETYEVYSFAAENLFGLWGLLPGSIFFHCGKFLDWKYEATPLWETCLLEARSILILCEGTICSWKRVYRKHTHSLWGKLFTGSMRYTRSMWKPCLSGVGSILIRCGELVSNRRCNCYIQLLTKSKGHVMMRLLEARGMWRWG